MLYLVATPIGNLRDITFRAIDILKASDYILAEDTRKSRILCQKFEIDTPLVSYHKFNEAKLEKKVLKDIYEGKIISLISDAGTPGISDPGSRLVATLVKEKIKVISIPGPCAAIAAITSSGFNTELFQFLGFLPKLKNPLEKTLTQILSYPGTSICYESPHRLIKTLNSIKNRDAEREMAVARELTKAFEEVVRGRAADLITYYNVHPLKGEIVLLISGHIDKRNFDLSYEEHVLLLEKTKKLTRQEAIKEAAKERGIPKRIIYNELIKNISLQN